MHLCEISRTLDRHLPETEAVARLLKRRAYQLIDEYLEFPGIVRGQFKFDVNGWPLNWQRFDLYLFKQR